MPEGHIVRSPSASWRLQEAERWLEEQAGEGEVLVLCAHLEAGNQIARSLGSRRGALFGIHRVTLNVLAYQLALPRLVEAGVATHSLLGQQALAARVAHQAKEDGGLGVFSAVVHGPGFARALAATLNELRLHEVAPADLAATGTIGKSLAELLERYQKASLSAGLADRTEVLRTATRVAEETAEPHHPCLGLPTLILDVPVRTPLEKHFIASVVRRARKVLATLPEGDEPTRGALEEALAVSTDVVFASGDTSESVHHLQRYLFSGAAPPRRPTEQNVVVLSAPGEAQEAVELARYVQSEAASGVPFDSMAVLLRAPDLYTPLLEDAFARAGVPAHFETGTPRPAPAGRAFLALLDCTAEDLSASRFAEYLSLGQLPELDESGGPEHRDEVPWIAPQHELAPPPPGGYTEPVQLDLFAPPAKSPTPEKLAAIEGTLRAPWRWERLLVDAAVIGGRERWERRLAGLARELRERIVELDDPEGTEGAALEHRLEDLKHLEAFALPVIEMLAELPEKATWGRWLDVLERLASRVLSLPDGVLAVLKELRPMALVGPVELFEVREVLNDRLTQLSQDPPPYRYGRVWVAPIEAARGLAFDVVLVPGLAERVFPRKIVEDPLLLDVERQKLGAGLALQGDRIADERLALRLAAGAARRKAVFSYPSVDLQKGRSKVPSFYLLEVVRASEGVLPDFETLEREASDSSGARLGWPAPRDPAQSIDETEHDLAFLSDALRQDTPKEQAQGTGRYLMKVNAALARSLRTRYQRGLPRFTSVDGFLDPSPDSKRLLSGHRFGARAFSVTSLEKFGACPYRFFLNAVLRLRPRETVEQITHLDPLTYGRILHVAQYEILQKLQQENLTPVRPENLAAALQVAEKVFNRVAEEFRELLAPAIERIWRDELGRVRTDLRGWLRRESESPGGWVPHRTEFTFGMRPQGPADPSSVLEEAVLPSGLRLRGAIDLVEKRADGKARVTDYKSGRVRVPEGAVLFGGESLQPILYSLAYEALTGEEVVAARLYYCTERSGYAERMVEPDEEALEVVAEFHRRVDKAIEEGFFPATPRLGCKYCDYLPVCGPGAEINAKRKEGDPRLSLLNWLRNLR
jgi:hypothetical protein